MERRGLPDCQGSPGSSGSQGSTEAPGFADYLGWQDYQGLTALTDTSGWVVIRALPDLQDWSALVIRAMRSRRQAAKFPVTSRLRERRRFQFRRCLCLPCQRLHPCYRSQCPRHRNCLRQLRHRLGLSAPRHRRLQASPRRR